MLWVVWNGVKDMIWELVDDAHVGHRGLFYNFIHSGFDKADRQIVVCNKSLFVNEYFALLAINFFDANLT